MHWSVRSCAPAMQSHRNKRLHAQQKQEQRVDMKTSQRVCTYFGCILVSFKINETESPRAVSLPQKDKKTTTESQRRSATRINKYVFSCLKVDLSRLKTMSKIEGIDLLNQRRPIARNLPDCFQPGFFSQLLSKYCHEVKKNQQNFLLWTSEL